MDNLRKSMQSKDHIFLIVPPIAMCGHWSSNVKKTTSVVFHHGVNVYIIGL
jgi:hypothetical protein